MTAAVLLIQAVKRWYQERGPRLPANSKEKQAFRDILKSWQRSIEGVPLEVSHAARQTLLKHELMPSFAATDIA